MSNIRQKRKKEMSNIRQRRKKEERQVLTGEDKYSDEKTQTETKKNKGRICSGKKCLLVTMTLPAIWEAIKELGHNPDPSLRQTTSTVEVALCMRSNSMLTRSNSMLKKELEENKKKMKHLQESLDKERQEVLKQKQLVKQHANQGVVGAAKKAIKNFIVRT